MCATLHTNLLLALNLFESCIMLQGKYTESAGVCGGWDSFHVPVEDIELAVVQLERLQQPGVHLHGRLL